MHKEMSVYHDRVSFSFFFFSFFRFSFLLLLFLVIVFSPVPTRIEPIIN